MIGFEYINSTKIIFGKDAISKLGENVKKLGYKKVLVHYGNSFAGFEDILNAAKTSLIECNISFIELGGVVPNPEYSLVKKGIDIALKEKVDMVLAIGGGSVIDSAKAIAYGMANDFDIIDLFFDKVKAVKCAPVACVLTIAASGSESSNSTVINFDIDSKTFKRAYDDDISRPVFAILDPSYTLSLTKYQSVCGYADIMMHTMERYFSKTKSSELIDGMAESLMRTVVETASKLLEDEKSYDLRSTMMLAGSLSHNGLFGIGKESDFATHLIGHEISAKYGVAHGASLTAVWSSWARFCLLTNPKKLGDFARNVFNVGEGHSDFEDGLKGIKMYEEFIKSLGLPISISSFKENISNEEIEEIAESATLINKSIGNYVKLAKEDIVNILLRSRDNV